MQVTIGKKCLNINQANPPIIQQLLKNSEIVTHRHISYKITYSQMY